MPSPNAINAAVSPICTWMPEDQKPGVRPGAARFLPTAPAELGSWPRGRSEDRAGACGKIRL
ncbi:hypothetical protein EAO74_08790 [Streptomyces sp. gb1(2016)]|uniref:Uncharacterized protein n=1 Tax=Streptomyces sp. gb1(2016) TaxID=1828321 RepID=A0A652L6X0_9ACTN|nr:hypothetical protein EAO74_08790 [Streptomyces sp. gb1(2016)]